MKGFYPPVPLSQLCRVQSGYAFKSADWRSAGVPVVQIGNVRTRRVDLEGCKFVKEDVAQAASRFRLKRGDILISMTGHIGIVGQVRGEEGAMLNQRVGRFEEIDVRSLLPSYLFQALQTEEIREQFVKLGYGAAQPNISPKLIGTVAIPVPPLDTQRRIAAILGAYDDLIEVNRRRIAVLEEIARGLFEEWFVRFRFPGHESVPIVDTPHGPLPSGWEWRELSRMAELKSGNNKLTKKAYRVEGVVAYSASGPDGFVESAGHVGPAVIVSAVGAYCGKTWLADGAWTTIANTFAVVPRPGVSATYLYLATLGIDRWPRRGAAQPFIAKGDSGAMKLPHGSADLHLHFDKVTSPLMRMIETVGQQNQRLAASRDLLLPRLISGQLSVEAAERELELAA